MRSRFLCRSPFRASFVSVFLRKTKDTPRRNGVKMSPQSHLSFTLKVRLDPPPTTKSSSRRMTMRPPADAPKPTNSYRRIMATATLPLARQIARTPATAAARVGSATGAAVLSILGSMAAIGIATIGLLVVPVAALVVFGPVLLDLLT